MNASHPLSEFHGCNHDRIVHQFHIGHTGKRQLLWNVESVYFAANGILQGIGDVFSNQNTTIDGWNDRKTSGYGNYAGPRTAQCGERGVIIILSHIIGVERIGSFEFGSFGREISFVECTIVYLSEITQEMFGFYIQPSEFRFLEKKIFVFIIFETKSESEAEVFVPDIRKAKFS